MTGAPTVAVPAQVELDDRLVGPVTFRMAGWLAVAVLGVALVAGAGLSAAPAGGLLVAAGVAGAVCRPGDRPLTAWIAPLWAYRRRVGATAAPPRPRGGTVTRPRRPLLLAAGVLTVALAAAVTVAVATQGAAPGQRLPDRHPLPAPPPAAGLLEPVVSCGC